MTEHSPIRERREALGWSQSRLADAARALMAEPDPKLVQQSIDRIEKGSNSKYKIFVLQALDLPIPGAAVSRAAPPRRMVLPPSSVEIDEGAPPFRSQAGRRDVEELGVAVGGRDGDFDMNGEVVGRVPRPPALVGRDVFAVRVKNDSMAPRYEEGHLLYVERRREPSPGDDAIIELHPTEDGQPGRAFIKRLVSKGMATVVVKQFNPEDTITFNRREVKALYRVVPWNEAFGV